MLVFKLCTTLVLLTSSGDYRLVSSFDSHLQADAQGLPCFVEVTRSDLVPVYAALGFDALEQCDPFGVTVFLMKRLPRQRLGVASAGKNTL
jgi:hypothetical protein